MFRVVLFQPEIPPNTGNIIRLCANVGAELHLVRPLGFDLDDAKLRRAGLDYREWVNVKIHDDLASALNGVVAGRAFAFTTKAARFYGQVAYLPGDAFVFGPETRGLPADTLAGFSPEQWLRIPMQPQNRSLNLSNSAAVVVYEAWRQQGFVGGV